MIFNTFKKKEMPMKKVFFCILLVSLLAISPAYAQEERQYLMKDNNIAIKAGWHFYPESDFTNFWGTDESLFFELSCGRRIRKNIGIEFSLGYLQSNHDNTNVAFINDSSKLRIENLYLTPSAKFFFPVSDRFNFYLGGGPDLYYTWSNHEYRVSNFTVNKQDSFFSVGLHGLTGIDWYIYTEPTKREYNAPVSLFLEYKYSWVEINNADKLMTEFISNNFGSSIPEHDLDAGGHMIAAGLRWHY